MKIAFISYEYPPDTNRGGIATYVHQAAQLLSQRGHHVEVFSGSSNRYGTEEKDGVIVHRIQEDNRHMFPKHVGKVFAARHTEVKFDVLEGPDIFAEAREAVRLVPDIPLVVKLHTPTFLINKINAVEIPLPTRIRPFLGELRRGKNPLKSCYNPKTDIECAHALEADEVVILTKSMGEKVSNTWGLDQQCMSQIPNPYVPSSSLLNIQINTQTNWITFIGRLEVRKGVIDLAKAIPFILKQHPTVKFRFVGRSVRSPNSALDMHQYLEQLLGQSKNSVEFTGSISLDDIPSILANTDICIFPSIWENFPNVCLEAMAAARGVIGSSAGGMAEMLDYGQAGRLVPPHSSRKIAEAVNELIAHPSLRMQLGQLARARVLAEYNAERIGALLEASYQRAIKRRKMKGSRYQNRILSFVEV